MRAHFGLPSVVSEETEGKPPIQVKFEIPYFTTSGIQVKKKNYPLVIRAIYWHYAQSLWFLIWFWWRKSGSLLEDYREKWLPSASLGALHHSERRLPVANQLSFFFLIIKPKIIYQPPKNCNQNHWGSIKEEEWNTTTNLNSIYNYYYYFLSILPNWILQNKTKKEITLLIINNNFLLENIVYKICSICPRFCV